MDQTGTYRQKDGEMDMERDRDRETNELHHSIISLYNPYHHPG